jgi:two-component system sensor histidine kinase RpfC
MRGWLNRIRARLAARADSEHEMSLNRLAFLVLMTVYLLFDPVAQESGALAVMGLGLVAVVGIFVHLLCFPAPNTSRRVFAACCDLFTIAFQIHAGGKAGAAFYPLLLWTVLGNGFRFGTRWLAISGGIAFVGFAAVVATTPFWRQQVPLCVGLGAALLIIPAYTATLIRKLDSARRQAEIANAAKTMFLASVSHELRTPLHAIMGAQAALQATPLDHNQMEMSGIARQVRRSCWPRSRNSSISPGSRPATCVSSRSSSPFRTSSPRSSACSRPPPRKNPSGSACMSSRVAPCSYGGSGAT